MANYYQKLTEYYRDLRFRAQAKAAENNARARKDERWRKIDNRLSDIERELAFAELNGEEEKRLALYHRASRDSARTPVPWTGGENAGFTTGTPWFYVNENYPEINVEQALADPDSILNFYKKAIALRKRLPVVRDGSYPVYERNSDALYVYARETKEQKLLVVCSFTDRPVRFCPPYPFSLDDMKLLLCNYPDAGSGASFVTRPYEARVYLYE